MMNSLIDPNIAKALAAIDRSLLGRSGSVFYTGRSAFNGNANLYILGLNPGGDPVRQASETIARDIGLFLEYRQHWSAYRDERWAGALAGTWGMQPRILHMLARLGLDARDVPASNVVFVRSTGEKQLNAEKAELLAACWPVHSAVIESLGIATILCFGGTAGRWVREKLGATERIDGFVETNLRGWRSDAHIAVDGRAVITVTHPGRTAWQNPAADPTPLVRRVLDRYCANG